MGPFVDAQCSSMKNKHIEFDRRDFVGSTWNELPLSELLSEWTKRRWKCGVLNKWLIAVLLPWHRWLLYSNGCHGGCHGSIWCHRGRSQKKWGFCWIWGFHWYWANLYRFLGFYHRRRFMCGGWIRSTTPNTYMADSTGSLHWMQNLPNQRRL